MSVAKQFEILRDAEFEILCDAEFEIISDETIELLDENNENILLRMIYVKSAFNNLKKHVFVFDSKKGFYYFSSNTTNQFPQIEHFYYSSGLKHPNGKIAEYTVYVMRNGNVVDGWSPYGCPDPIIGYFNNNQNEYYPTFGLTNFELK